MSTTTNQTGGGRSRLRQEAGMPSARPVSEIERFRYQLNLIRKDVASLIGAEKVDKFIRVTLNAVQRNPDMLDPRSRRSLFIACLEAAQDGLLPDGTEAVFNVYNTKVKIAGTEREEWVPTVQYLPMAYGLIQKMYEIPGVTFVDAVAVYERDKFEYDRGDEPKIVHVPYGGDEEPGKVIASYVVVKSKDRETKREVMFRRDIEKVRKKSKAPNGLMWKEDESGFYDQGAIKSVIHRVFKQLPQAERLQRSLAYDNKAIGLVDVAAPISAEDSGMNLEAIVDSRFDQSMRDQVIQTAGKTVEGEIVKNDDAGPEKTGAAAEAQPTPGATGAITPPPAEAKPPKQGDPGTAEIKTKIMGKLDRSTASDELDLFYDEVRFYTWEAADLEAFKAKYDERRKALGAA